MVYIKSYQQSNGFQSNSLQNAKIAEMYQDTLFTNLYLYRRNQRKCSMKKCVLNNFAKLTGKHLCQSLFENSCRRLKTKMVFLLAKKRDPKFLQPYLMSLAIFRSSRWQMFSNIGVLKHFSIFTGKHLYGSVFPTLLKILQQRCFPVKIANF